MDERDVVGLYIAEMRALLPLVQRHIGTLASAVQQADRAVALRETVRLATAMADLSSGFHAEDCAQLSHALVRAFAVGDPGPGPHSARLAAAGADILTYLQLRMSAMSGQSRVLSPGDAERASCLRLLAAIENVGTGPGSLRPGDTLPGARLVEPQVAGGGSSGPALASEADERITRPLMSVAPSFEGTAGLTNDEMAMLHSFHASRLRLTPPVAPSEPPGMPPQQPTTLAGAPSGSLPAAPAEQPEVNAEADLPGDAPAYAQAPTNEELDAIPPEMKRVFVVETAEDLNELRLHLLAFEEHAEDTEPVLAMSRIAHKIRGAASTLGFDVLAELSFLFEDVLKTIYSRRVTPQAQSAAALLRCLTLLQDALAAAHSERDPDPDLVSQARAVRDELVTAAMSATYLAGSLTPSSSGPSAPRPAAAEAQDATLRPPAAVEGDSLLRVDVRRLDHLMTHVSDLALNRASLAQTREDAVRLQDEMDHSLARLAALSAEIIEAHPLQDGAGPLPRRTALPGSDHLSNGSAAGQVEHGQRAKQAATRVGLTRPIGNGQAWDDLEMLPHDDLDHALRVLVEVVADLTSTSRTLRSTMNRLSVIVEEQAGVATEVQQDVMYIRLVPLSDLVPRLQVEARRLASHLGKQLTLSVHGDMTQIDRNISEALTGPLLQLVRNAAVHGIESPDERRAAGKPEAGSIWLHAYYVGSEVIIEVGDDGRGINPHRLIASAVASGLLEPAAARMLSLTDALDLMFEPGVSTFGEAQVLGGRGIGLDDVRTAIEALKGRIHVSSSTGQSTVIRIRVPISLSIVRAMLVRAGEHHYAIPFASVLRSVTLAPADILPAVILSAGSEGSSSATGQPALARRRIRVERTALPGEPPVSRYEEIPLCSLAELLGFDRVERELELALVVEVGRSRLAMLVDDVYGDQEVVVKALPKHLRRRAVRGATVTPTGEVLLLLDVPALAAPVLGGGMIPGVRRRRPITRPLRALAPRVLVVDDSISIRRSLETALDRAGFEVQLARDGIEALEMMLVSPPRVVVLDIEMPRLDGFELLSILRGSRQFQGVRVAMLTSRATDKHRAHALSLGAEAYLVKPCPNETLIETVRQLIEEPASIV